MKFICSIFLLCSVLLSFSQKLRFKNIPEQDLFMDEVLETYFKDTVSRKVPAFGITNFITLGQYKSFLKEVKADTSFSYYYSLEIDTNICSNECYSNYISNTGFESEPALGVSWEAAMALCKYYTLKHNKTEDLEFIYRLPTLYEWAAAYNYLEKKSDQNKYYSDWTMNTYYEANYNYTNDQFLFNIILDSSYPTYEGMPPVLKRKIRVGNSFDFQTEKLDQSIRRKYTYSYIGYKDIGFRLIKAKVDDLYGKEVLKYWGIE